MYHIICDDALKWLKKIKNGSIPNICTGIPDFEETSYKSLDQYIKFIKEVVELIFMKINKKGYVLMAQTDRKIDKKWLDKSYIIQNIAEKCNIPLRWHKIVLLRNVGSTHIQRPTYQQYLCFSYEGGPGESTPDVFLCGDKDYKNSSCKAVIHHSIDFLKKYAISKIIVDPFVGRGSILEHALKNGFNVIGIDINKEQCDITKELLKKFDK